MCKMSFDTKLVEIDIYEQHEYYTVHNIIFAFNEFQISNLDFEF